MKIKNITIQNFKSIGFIDIIEPNPFTVFVGPNGAGKSNIFEAMEFWSFQHKGYREDSISLFGGVENILHYDDLEYVLNVSLEFPDEIIIDSYGLVVDSSEGKPLKILTEQSLLNIERFTGSEYYKQFVKNYSRLFINNPKGNKLNLQDDSKLTLISNNLEKVLGRILKDEVKKEDILDWLSMFIPEFEDVFIESTRSKDELIVKEKFSTKDFRKEMLSDGTYNILALLTAVFQSDEPQFLCIEEPENGLTPYVIREMVTLFRNACEEKGHYIWLNTHSQSLVSELTADEIITVNKIKGETKIKQFKGKDFHGLRMDEAWLTNTLGGGLPW